MARPYTLAFGPWMPDGADIVHQMPFQWSATTVPLADCSNVYYADSAYRSLSSFAALAGGALASACLGAFTGIDSSGSPQIFAGAGSDLYHWSGSTWSNVSKSAGAYAGASRWSFAQLGDCVLGADGVHALQDIATDGSAFADIAGAPIGKVLGVIGQFVLVGSLIGTPNYPSRVQWCAIGDPTTWPTPLTDAAVADQSSYEDLEQQLGEVLFIGGGPQLGVILQRNGITRATYQGGDTVFSFLPFERKRGLIAPGAAVQAGALTHFIADDGFYVTDGSEAKPVGTTSNAQLDKWFWSTVNPEALDAIRAAWDASLRCIAYAIPTGSNTAPDTLLLLNPQSGQWTKSALACEELFTDNDGTRSRLGVFSLSHGLGYLTGAASAGYLETYDLAFIDGAVRSIGEAQPQILCTDSPTMRIGTKAKIDDAPTYTADNGRDAFSGRCTFDPPAEGLMVRARVTSAAATSIAGCTLYPQTGGSV